MINLAILLSGTGTNFQSIAKAIDEGRLDAKIVLVGSNNPDAPGLKYARNTGLNTALFIRSDYAVGKLFSNYMLEQFRQYEVDIIALSGYLRKIPPAVIRAFPNRIVNIHPALLPRHGGKGMYGLNVHQAVIDSGDCETGVTVHYANENYDEGAIIDQSVIAVNSEDTAQTLAKRVLKVEHEFYPEVLQRLSIEYNNERQTVYENENSKSAD